MTKEEFRGVGITERDICAVYGKYSPTYGRIKLVGEFINIKWLPHSSEQMATPLKDIISIEVLKKDFWNEKLH